VSRCVTAPIHIPYSHTAPIHIPYSTNTHPIQHQYDRHQYTSHSGPTITADRCLTHIPRRRYKQDYKIVCGNTRLSVGIQDCLWEYKIVCGNTRLFVGIQDCLWEYKIVCGNTRLFVGIQDCLLEQSPSVVTVVCFCPYILLCIHYSKNDSRLICKCNKNHS